MKQLTRFISVTAVVITAFVLSVQAQTQQTNPPVLPEFSALIKTGKIQLDFISGFRDVKSIGVQRSLDSVLNFYTIGYIKEPNVYRGIYEDFKPLPGTNYYRMLVVFNNGRFFFTKTMLAITDSTIRDDQKLTLADVKEAMAAAKAAGNPNAVTNPNAPPGKEKEKEVPKIVWHPSNYVYTTADGNVNIKLNDAPSKHYSIKFFEADGTFLFNVDQVKEPFLILEKAIFMHSGWFNFEIYEDNKLYEKWNLFIPLTYRN